MTGAEFIRKLKALAKSQGVTVTIDESRGKGSHRTLYYGHAFTVIRNLKDELKTGTLQAMCSQLGIKSKDLKGE
jgi:mRNA interferase HicA